MNKSDSIKELATALAKAQGAIKGATKDSTNAFFKNKYADLSSVVEAIRQPLADAGLSYVQISHESKDAACIETVILHSSGEWLSCGPVSVPVTKADAQGFGSAMTYSRRYSLSAAFGVAPEDDDGNAAAAAKPKAREDDDPKGSTKRGETPGVIVDQTLALESLPVESRDAARRECKAIEGDFYMVSAKAATERWSDLAKDMNADEEDACWKLLDSKVRSGIKKYLEAARAV